VSATGGSLSEESMNISVTTAPPDDRKEITKDDELGFGQVFTDHMFLWNYDPKQRWHEPRIVPYQALSLSPACAVLHYAQQVFEGLKAYHGVDGRPRLFRPEANLERMRRSAERMCIPFPSEQSVLEAIEQLVALDKRWIPRSEGCALYVRPNLIATDPFLGIRPSNNYLLYIILCPVGAYYPEGFDAITILVEEHYVRAFSGGCGEAKTGGNYAASLRGQVEAKKQGITQVLWLDGKEHQYVEEVGTMNIFFRFDDEVVTPPLTGSILPGVTRDSVLKVLRRWDEHQVNERPITIDEVIEGAVSGRLIEVFGTGTAAIVSPVKSLQRGDETYVIGNGQTGPLAKRLYHYILDLQYGKEPDPFGWIKVLGEG
jgi:branched-chain amino acid aminotransferase